jgi:AcrR family transcriptional regulator
MVCLIGSAEAEGVIVARGRPAVGAAAAAEHAWSPKQLARRELILEAAVERLKREGVAGCTVRAIAAATPFTKGTIHYYFTDINEIIELAYLRLTGDYGAAVEAVALAESKPERAFWRGVTAYLEGFRVHRSMGLMWFEYTSWAARNGHERGVTASVEVIQDMFARRLAAIDTDLTGTSAALVRYLLGAVLELGTARLDLEPIFNDIAHICHLGPPVRQLPRSHDAVCPLCGADRR